MIDTRTNKRLCNAVLWCIAGMALVILLTSCSPYAAQTSTIVEPTPSATATGFISVIKPTPTPYPSCVVSGGTVYLRSGPSMTSAVMKILYKGERLHVIEPGEWLEVQAHGRASWVYWRYCR